MARRTRRAADPSNAGLSGLEALLDARAAALGAAATPGADAALIAVTDGLAIELSAEQTEAQVAAAAAAIAARLGPGWTLRDDSAAGMRALTALPPPGEAPPVGDGWELARDLAALHAWGIRSVVPLFAQRAPLPPADRAAAPLAAAAAAAAPPHWHLAELAVRAAWQRTRAAGHEPGAGVTVAVIDTGYTDHPEITARLAHMPDHPNTVRGIDLIDGGDPRDPLEGRFPVANPSHGTSVTSVIASPPEAQETAQTVTGIAPAAEILTVRVTTSVVVLLPNKLIPGFREAAAAGADVINVSLGAPYGWPALYAAIRAVMAQGVIVVGASGNYWPYVVYPAAFPEVIAAAACDVDRRPWRWASAGSAVDVLAPGVAIQCAVSTRRGQRITYGVQASEGTTFAAASCSALAALWLAHHGGRQNLIQHYNGNAQRIPQAFQYLLRLTAQRLPDLPPGRYGAGLAQADALLAAPLPTSAVLDDVGRDQPLLFGFADSTDPLGGHLFGREAQLQDLGLEQADAQVLLGMAPAAPLFADLVREVRFQLAGRPDLLAMLHATPAGMRAATLREQLRAGNQISPSLRRALDAATPGLVTTPAPSLRRPPAPIERRLQVYASDPSFAAQLQTIDYNVITVQVRWEALAPGPVGEYLEVIDTDPASRSVYAPLNLDDPHVLGAGGLAPNEADPQFHQQMVYAVAMKTIGHFEQALGRPIFWASEPYQDPNGRWFSEPFVQRLRIFPHALRAQNAYYSPAKRALLFGYFRAPGPDGADNGPTVFTALSYEIIAHETTHAVLDGIYHYLVTPTNPDVPAFHEAFSDLVALFQHFTHPDLLRAAIEETRGDLEAESRLGKLAQQFGESTGRRGALRDAIGKIGPDGVWRRRTPDASLLQRAEYRVSAHLRGSILVAMVFDAFLQIYRRRTRRLIRLATGGSGVLPPGAISADLVAALADEAAKTARHMLNICIRALDYLMPVNITFGDYLRALITADRDLVPNDNLGYRVAFADASRRWGIYAAGVTTVAPDSLCWEPPEGGAAAMTLPMELRDRLNRLLTAWRADRDRAALHRGTLGAKAELNRLLQDQRATDLGAALGINLNRSFEVHSLRPATSIGPDGDLNQMIVATLTQRISQTERLRTGTTILFNLSDGRIRYIVRDRGGAAVAEAATKYRQLQLDAAAERDPYAVGPDADEPFAALHLTGRP